jgi:hypothetical protein
LVAKELNEEKESCAKEANAKDITIKNSNIDLVLSVLVFIIRA